jgi:hypothetical protein
MKKMNIAAAIVALAVAGVALAGQFVVVPPASPTGGVARVAAPVGEVARIDWKLDGPATVAVVASIDGATIATTTVASTNAAAAGRWVPGSSTWLGGNDAIVVTSETNTTAKLYVETK